MADHFTKSATCRQAVLHCRSISIDGLVSMEFSATHVDKSLAIPRTRSAILHGRLRSRWRRGYRWPLDDRWCNVELLRLFQWWSQRIFHEYDHQNANWELWRGRQQRVVHQRVQSRNNRVKSCTNNQRSLLRAAINENDLNHWIWDYFVVQSHRENSIKYLLDS